MLVIPSDGNRLHRSQAKFYGVRVSQNRDLLKDLLHEVLQSYLSQVHAQHPGIGAGKEQQPLHQMRYSIDFFQAASEDALILLRAPG